MQPLVPFVQVPLPLHRFGQDVGPPEKAQDLTKHIAKRNIKFIFTIQMTLRL